MIVYGACTVKITMNGERKYHFKVKQAVREAATICPRPCKVTFDLLTSKAVSESRVTWATSVPILVFLGLSVLDLGPMYATDRQTNRRQTRIIA